jgi:MORN repeat variant
MKLFEVSRWGNEEDGSNGSDTNYLVCAHDHEEAATLVREREPNLAAITELGVCSADVERSVILRGPYIEHKLERGTYFTLWSWDPRGLDVWVPTARCRDGEATCHYADGQIAARCRWQDAREHGIWELWYPDGQLMHRGEYQRGKMVGIHEYWYRNGTPASRYEYVAGGVRYQQWNRQGGLIDEATEHWGHQTEKNGQCSS